MKCEQENQLERGSPSSASLAAITESGGERLSASPPSAFCFVSASGCRHSLSLTSSPSMFQGKESGCSLNEEHCDLIGCLLSLQRTADLT